MGPEVFFDADVLLDVLFERKPHLHDSQRVLALAETREIRGCTSALVLANCHYLISHVKGKIAAQRAVAKLRSILKVLPFSDVEIGESLSSNFSDFEDGIQHFICVNHGVGILLTRNTRDYKKAALLVLTPAAFLGRDDLKSHFEKGAPS